MPLLRGDGDPGPVGQEGSPDCWPIGRCSQEDELCGIYRHTRTAAGLRLGRMVLEMNDDLWDTYQACLERQG